MPIERSGAIRTHALAIAIVRLRLASSLRLLMPSDFQVTGLQHQALALERLVDVGQLRRDFLEDRRSSLRLCHAEEYGRQRNAWIARRPTLGCNQSVAVTTETSRRSSSPRRVGT